MDEATAGCPEAEACGVFELRRYRLHPGRREPLIALFDREFVETQEAVGIAVIGQFRDLDAPDDFVWIRGFADMERRAAALAAFYGGPVWAAHRDAANATMITFDDVHLLRRIAGRFGLAARPPVAPDAAAEAAPDTGPDASPLVIASLFPLVPATAGDFPDVFADLLAPRLRAAGLAPFVTLVTEASENTFPRLPVHTRPVLAALARAADAESHAAAAARLARDAGWRAALAAAAPLLSGAPESFRLAPTRRSRLC